MIDFLKLKNFKYLRSYCCLVVIVVIHFVGCSKNPDELRKDAVKYFDQALDYYTRGYYSNAEKLFSEVISIEEKIKLKDYSGDSYLYLGMISFDEGNFLSALKYYESAKLNYKSKLLRNKESIAENNIGNVYASTGNFNKAKASYRNAIGISQLAADKEGEADGYSNLGMLNFIEGNYQHAFNNFSKALDAYQFLNNTGGIILASMRLGEAYLRFGAIQDAIAAFEFCLNISIESGLNQYLPELYNNIGLCFFHLNRLAEAESAFEKSLDEISNRKLISDYAWIAAVNLGDVYYQTYRYSDALRQYNKAIAHLDELGEGFPNAFVKLKTAMIYLQSGLDKNEQDLNRAEMVFKNLSEYFDDLDFQTGVINSITGLAKCYLASNRRKDAEAFMKDLNRLMEKNSISLKNKITENFAIIPQITGSINLNEYFFNHSKANDLIEFNMRIDENNKRYLLKNQLYFNLSDVEKNELIDSLKQVDSQIDFLSFELANEKSNEKYSNSKKIKSYQILLKEIGKKYDNKLLKVLLEEFNLKQNINLKDIQKRLDSSSALLAFISFEDSILACVISGNRIKAVSIPLNNSVLKGQINALGQNLKEANIYSSASILNGMYNRIINPIELDISNFHNLFIYTSGSDFLDMIPFHALIDNDKQILLSKYHIFYFSGISSGAEISGNSNLIVHDGSARFKNIDTKELTANLIKTSNTLKDELLNKDINSIIFLTGAYYNPDQNFLIYLETFSDSASMPEFNITLGEAKALRVENIFTKYLFTYKNEPVKQLAGLFPNAKNFVIERYSLPEKIHGAFESEIIKKVNLQTNFSRLLKRVSEELPLKERIYAAAYFHYVQM